MFSSTRRKPSLRSSGASGQRSNALASPSFVCYRFARLMSPRWCMALQGVSSSWHVVSTKGAKRVAVYGRFASPSSGVPSL